MDNDDGKVEETLDAIRARIARMSDKELAKYGASAASLLSSPGLAVIAVRELEEARAEWHRRHPKAGG